MYFQCCKQKQNKHGLLINNSQHYTPEQSTLYKIITRSQTKGIVFVVSILFLLNSRQNKKRMPNPPTTKNKFILSVLTLSNVLTYSKN